MKLNDKQIQRLVFTVMAELKEQKQITFKAKEDKVHQRAVELVKLEYQKERELDMEVNRMMDQLEQQNSEFERYKMFPLLKKRLAKEKGIIL